MRGALGAASRPRQAVGRVGLALALMLTLTALPSEPASATEGAGFTDIRTSPHAGYIEAIAAAGITGGCAPERYCPQGQVTRAQMATFLMKALDLPAGPLGFTDVPITHAHAAGIGAVALAGITSGYDDGTFRPSGTVSRGQMATFLMNALDLPDGEISFNDVSPNHAHAAGIRAVAAAEITTGCGGGGYCPNDPVTRAQMATFLGRALHLEPIFIDYPEPPPPVAPDTGTTALVADFMAGTDYAHAYTLGTDTWKVWVCKVPTSTGGERVNVDLNAAVSLMRTKIVPYFTWMSEGVYTLKLDAGGTFTLSADDPLISWPLSACMREAEKRSSGAKGALAILDIPIGQGVGGIGSICGPEPCTNPTVLPNSHRSVAVGSVAVQAYPQGWYPEPALSIVAHEIGHALGFPHSFAQGSSGSWADEYSDPIDVMSGAHQLVGTIAANRFGAGWLGEKAKLHAGGTREYTVGSVGYGGTQMVLVPSSSSRAFTSIGALTSRDYNVNFYEKVEGVTLHRVDQRPEVCQQYWFTTDCRHTERRQAPIAAPNTTDHVLGVGQSRDIGGVTVTVLERVGDGYRIRVSGDRANFSPLTR